MIHGYHECKVVWWDNPVVGEDLLCEHEVGNPHNMHVVYRSLAWPHHFFLLCGGREILAPHKTEKAPVSGHTRLRIVAIKNLSTVT